MPKREAGFEFRATPRLKALDASLVEKLTRSSREKRRDLTAIIADSCCRRLQIVSGAVFFERKSSSTWSASVGRDRANRGNIRVLVLQTSQQALFSLYYRAKERTMHSKRETTLWLCYFFHIAEEKLV
jgi:hypothetical protein